MCAGAVCRLHVTRVCVQGEEDEEGEGFSEEKVDAAETARTISTVTGSARLNPLQLHILELVLEDLNECMEGLAPGAGDGSGAWSASACARGAADDAHVSVSMTVWPWVCVWVGGWVIRSPTRRRA